MSARTETACPPLPPLRAIIDDARERDQAEAARLPVRPWTREEDLLNAELRSRSLCPCATSSGARARGGTRALG